MPDAATPWAIQVRSLFASVMDVTVRTASVMDVIDRTGKHGRMPVAGPSPIPKRTARNLRIERTLIHAVLPQGRDA